MVVDVVFDGEVVGGEHWVGGSGWVLGGDFAAVGVPDAKAAVVALEMVGVVVDESVMESAE